MAAGTIHRLARTRGKAIQLVAAVPEGGSITYCRSKESGSRGVVGKRETGFGPLDHCTEDQISSDPPKQWNLMSTDCSLRSLLRDRLRSLSIGTCTLASSSQRCRSKSGLHRDALRRKSGHRCTGKKGKTGVLRAPLKQNLGCLIRRCHLQSVPGGFVSNL